jgi:uncharacterized protein (TIGR03435 family)
MRSLARGFPAGLLALAAIAGLAFGQAAAPASTPLSFEVASIKPAPPIDMAAIASGKLPHIGMSVDNDRVDIGGLPLVTLICMAYKVKPHEVAGNPSWMNAGVTDDRFNILAKMPEGATKEQVPEMLQALLAERFKLAIHREKREATEYVLMVGKGGPKLKEAAPAPPTPVAEGAAASSRAASGTGPAGAKPVTSSMRMTMTPNGNGTIRMEFDNSMTMGTFAATLNAFVGGPVTDMTGLKGKYEVSLELSRDAIQTFARNQGMNAGMFTGAAATTGLPADSALEPSGGSIVTAIQQLGLKLERRKVPADFVVIDHVERTPSEN